jgi:polyisoprenoid-binding protein YceI
MNRFIALSASLLLTASMAYAQTWKVERFSVGFSIKNAGITIEGKFDSLQADIRFEPNQPEKAVIEAAVPTASINTGINLRDKHLRGKEYFDAENFPTMMLVSKKIEPKGNNTFIGEFALTIKGVTKTVSIPFSFNQKNSSADAEATFTLNRRDFGVGGASFIMADTLTVTIKLSTKLTDSVN